MQSITNEAVAHKNVTAFLVGIQNKQDTAEDTQELLFELAELSKNLRWEIVGQQLVHLREPQARYLLGEGRTEGIVTAAKEAGASIIVIDGDLSPAQQRNWETLAKIPVIDRQEVILNIFEERAQTHEARLQVQLARLQHTLPRLKRAWTHLSRQRGGGSLQRGEGEKQIELDSRMIRSKIAHIRRELREVVQHRDVQRKQRLKIPLPTAALVGYTNAGKSSLLNALTHSNVLVENKLFATLDPTTRRCVLPSGQTLLLTDTVGFIRKLPHALVEAFKATLEETLISDILIHALDGAHPEVEKQYAATMQVLEELGISRSKRIITVFNKDDLITNPITRLHLKTEHPEGLFVSAKTNQGLGDLTHELDTILQQGHPPVHYVIGHDRHDLIHELHSIGAILNQHTEDDGVHILAQIPARIAQKYESFKKTSGKSTVAQFLIMR
jgi:GTPase